MAKRILIVAGEASGDLHGSRLVKELKGLRPDLEFFGIGGDRMRGEGVELLVHADRLAFLGVAEVIRHLPFVLRVLRLLTRALEQRRPDLAILIDYPGFNLRFAARAKARGVPVFYYIAPQVWAWGKGRTAKLARRVDRMAVILPFEERIFREAGIDAYFVGHPIVEAVGDETPRDSFRKSLGVDEHGILLGLFPGSRRQEIERHLPEMCRLVALWQADEPGLVGAVSKAASVPEDVYRRALGKAREVRIALTDRHYALMHHADVLVVASGTATLEAACFGTPYVIVYRVSPLTYFLGRRLVTVPYLGLVNVVAGRRVVPEFLQNDFRAEKLRKALQTLLSDLELRRQMQANLEEVRRRLGPPGAARRTAELVLELLDK
ncbi:MAG: lipid-A-disaccharide synthase [candidate division KSB1 bacterium]|nr:lipid-A-disaccharide synthase [candidate division KSB1 bacterium]